MVGINYIVFQIVFFTLFLIHDFSVPKQNAENEKEKKSKENVKHGN